MTKKLTAKQISRGRNLPPRLITIGREIEAKASKADTYQTKADDMVASIRQLLVEAESYCDKGGFNAFRKKLCPSLGRSRAYELLAIASGKKSLAEVKAKHAVRQARHMAKLKAANRPSVTESGNVVPLRVESGDLIRQFSARVIELVFLTVDAKPMKFADTTAMAERLANSRRVPDGSRGPAKADRKAGRVT